MAVHIFLTNEENYSICIKRGLVGLPSSQKGDIFDGLLSRMTMIKENDYILIYVNKPAKELRGVWKADGFSFYDETEVWHDRVYPIRCKIKVSEYCFDNYLKLNDINDLINNNKIWTWALNRPTGSNAMFSISNWEFEVLINEYLKINPFSQNTWRIIEPYSVHEPNILDIVHKDNGSLKYESSVMTYLNYSFSNGLFKDIFGNYTDYLSYIPTNLGREMDILLMYSHPHNPLNILSYDIIEVKRDVFDETALSQLIDYESWFLQKKISGDMKMLRTTAIAKTFSDEVIDYVYKRNNIEHKPIKLIQYDYDTTTGFSMSQI